MQKYIRAETAEAKTSSKTDRQMRKPAGSPQRLRRFQSVESQGEARRGEKGGNYARLSGACQSEGNSPNVWSFQADSCKLAKKKLLTLPPVSETLLPFRPDDVLELDELWSFVGAKSNQRWLWTAMCRRTRQIVAFVNDDRSERACRALWKQIPEDCRKCSSFSDLLTSYATVFSEETHCSVDKESGETSHMERWNNTLRQRIGRFVRKTLSFSKSRWWHDKITHWFIVTYNSSILYD